jgi:acetoacetyl-CoA synthetase
MSGDVPEILWRPSEEDLQLSPLGRFAAMVGMSLNYEELWCWSVEDLDRFWSAIAEFFDVRFDHQPQIALADTSMPGAKWFPGAGLSYVEHIFRGHEPDTVAIHQRSEVREHSTWTWGRLREETSRIAEGLRALGVTKGDRVASYLPNIPETVAAFLAVASIGAVWSSAAPEFGVHAVVSRFRQIEPKVLLAVDGYRYRGREIAREAQGQEIAELTGARLIRFGYLDGAGWGSEIPAQPAGSLRYEVVPFDHPLWILYSSGTTGTPKAIVHGHGGVLLEHLKLIGLQQGVQPGDRYFWFSTTGWVMWNIVVGALLTGAEIVVYDGDPGGDALWDLAAAARVTLFGASAGYFEGCLARGIDPTRGRDLSALRAIGSTGSPLDPRCYDWVYDVFPASTWLFSTSGGSDVASGFLGAAPTPVYRGELAPAALGVDLRSYSPAGAPLVDELGEMVIAQPMPSMPLFFWNDPDGSRLSNSYFEKYPGVWTHGDWLKITSRRTGVITGRSDATINRGGVRFGTSELYDVVLAVQEIDDALAVDVPAPNTTGRLLLFVKPRPGAKVDDNLRSHLKQAIRSGLSPRHVPDAIITVSGVPRTSSGKRIELPIKRLLTGADCDAVLDRASLANPEALADFERYAAAVTTNQMGTEMTNRSCIQAEVDR